MGVSNQQSLDPLSHPTLSAFADNCDIFNAFSIVATNGNGLQYCHRRVSTNGNILQYCERRVATNFRRVASCNKIKIIPCTGHAQNFDNFLNR